MTVKLKRAYEAPSAGDGKRYLVERLWPRGASKESLALTDWLKDLAPSTELRRWYNHEAERWPEFVERYEAELQSPQCQVLVRRLADETRSGTVTLVFAARDTEHSSARVLKAAIEQAAR